MKKVSVIGAGHVGATCTYYIAEKNIADLVMIDPAQEWTVRGAAFASKGKITPFEGMTLRGRVVKTMLRGRVIYDTESGILAPGGYGRMIRAQA